MKLSLSILFSLLSLLPSLAQADSEEHLLVYFKDASHSLHMATSPDGYNFTAVNNGLPVLAGDTLSAQHGIRDPHIYRGPDGDYYMVMTDLHIYGRQMGFRTTQWERPDSLYDWGNNRGIVLLKSSDLIHWTHHEVFINELFPEAFGDLGCAWAPQTIYDPETRRMMIYLTIRPTGRGKTGLYYAYADKDFTTLTTEPKELFKYPDPKIQILDGDITPLPDGRYMLAYVAQEQPGGIKVAFSDHLTYGYQYQEGQVDSERGACEAPNVWKRKGEDKWVLMYDIFSISPHNFGFVETTDFRHFTPLGRFNEGPMRATNFQVQKHGAVITIPHADAERLRNYWRCQQQKREPYVSTLANTDILLSDPAIIADSTTSMYYMTGTGGQLWMGRDLEHWTGPYHVVRTNPYSWMGADPMIWAAEIHPYKGKYYYFATFTNRGIITDTIRGNAIERRASHVLVSDRPDGPYRPMKDPIYLPTDRPTLDGTFWVDTDGKPYLVYCGEWLQNWNGTVEKIELKPDLSGTVGEPKVLFRSSDCPWSKEKRNGKVVPNKVTDGPYLFRTATGRLGMLWTSWVYDVYTQGVAYSTSGTLDGPWIQERKPITPPNFGHGMLFQTLEGKWLMSVHSHKNVNGRTIRVPHLFEVDLSGDKLKVGKMIR